MRLEGSQYARIAYLKSFPRVRRAEFFFCLESVEEEGEISTLSFSLSPPSPREIHGIRTPVGELRPHEISFQ